MQSIKIFLIKFSLTVLMLSWKYFRYNKYEDKIIKLLRFLLAFQEAKIKSDNFIVMKLLNNL